MKQKRLEEAEKQKEIEKELGILSIFILKVNSLKSKTLKVVWITSTLPSLCEKTIG